MIITHLCDTHISLPEPDGSHRLDDLQATVDEINGLETQPDVVMHGGDIAHDGKVEEYVAAHDILKTLKAPLFVMPGNKDKRAAMGEVFGNYYDDCPSPDFIQYAIDNYETRIIVLDTLDDGERLGKLCDRRFADFEAMLAQEPIKPTVIFMHHPMFEIPEAPRPFQFISQASVDRIAELLLRNSQVKRIYCSHAHRFGKGIIGGVEASCISSTAVDLRFGDYYDGYRSDPIIGIYEH